MKFFLSKKAALSFIPLLVVTAAATLWSLRGVDHSSEQVLMHYAGPGSHWELDLLTNQNFTIRRYTQFGGAQTHVISGTFTRLTNDYIDFSISSTSGANLAVSQGSHLFGIELYGFSVALEDPFLPNKDLLYVVQRPTCPSGTLMSGNNYISTLNWAAEQYFGNKFVDEDVNIADGADIAGRGNLSRSASTLTLLQAYTSAPLVLSTNMVLNNLSCSNGTIGGGGDFRMYMSRYQAGIVRVDPTEYEQDKTLVLLPRTSFSISQLEGVYTGFIRDTGASGGQGDLYPVKVIFQWDGTASVLPFTSLSPATTGAQTHSVALTGANYNGYKGTFTGTITGAQTKPVVCNGAYRFGGGPRHLLHCVSASTSQSGKTTLIQTMILQRSEFSHPFPGETQIGVYNNTPVAAAPNGSFFISDQDLIDHVSRTQPFLGKDSLSVAGCTGHNGNHLHFSRPAIGDPAYSVNIYSPVAGVVTHINNCVQLDTSAPATNSMKKFDMRIRPGITETLAAVSLNLSLESMDESYITQDCATINNGQGFAAQFAVAVGATVSAGQLVATLPVPARILNGSGDNTHLHFDMTESNFPLSDSTTNPYARDAFLAPNLFVQDWADKFDGSRTAQGYPVSSYPGCNTTGQGLAGVTDAAENLLPNND